MSMEGRVKFFSPQNTAEVLQEKGIAVISQTIEVNSDQDSNERKIHNKTIKCLHTACPSFLDMPSCFENVMDAMFLTSLFTVACSI